MSQIIIPSRPRLPELFRDEVFRIETRRFWLRWPTKADADVLAEIVKTARCLCGDARWPLGWNGDVGGMAELVGQMRDANEAGEACFFVIADKPSPGALFGLVGIDEIPAGMARLGFVLDVRHQGYGMMTEAARGVVAAAFMYGGLARIRGSAAMEGIGARRVLEKCGFKPSATRDGGDAPCSAFEATPALRGKREVRAHKPRLSKGATVENGCGCSA